MKRLMSLATALALCLGLTIPAMANFLVAPLMTSFHKNDDLGASMETIPGFDDQRRVKHIRPGSTVDFEQDPDFEGTIQNVALTLLSKGEQQYYYQRSAGDTADMEPFSITFADSGTLNLADPKEIYLVTTSFTTADGSNDTNTLFFKIGGEAGSSVTPQPTASSQPVPSAQPQLSPEEAAISALTIRDGLDYNTMKFAADGFLIVSSGGGWGLIDSAGNEVLPPIYDHIGDVSEGMVVVGKRSNTAAGGMIYGFADTKGNVIVPPKYPNVHGFSEGRAMVTVAQDYQTDNGFGGTMTLHGSKVGYIDKTGKEVIPLIYMEGSSFSEGLAAVCDVDSRKWGMIDTNGNTVIPFQYDGLGDVSDGLVCFRKGGKEGAINTKGEVVIPAQFDFMNDFSEGYARVNNYTYSNGKYGIVDKHGKLVVPMIYDYIEDISEGMAAVRNSEFKWGYLNVATGELVVPFIYDTCKAFSDGLALVGMDDHRLDDIGYKDGKIKFYNGFIDKKGNVVVPLVYDYAFSFSDGVAFVFKGTAYPGWMDAGTLMNATFSPEVLKPFEERLGPAKSYCIDTTGNELPLYVGAEYSGNIGVVSRDHGYTLIRNPYYKETARPNRSTVLVDGQTVSFDAYTINQNNYFKLRDLAKVLSGTGKQFEVTWDGTQNAINLVSGKPYTVVGGELAQGDGANKTAAVNTATVYLDGQPVRLLAYTINQNNYFKLRDVGQAFDFDVSWDGSKNIITIDTTKSYTPD